MAKNTTPDSLYGNSRDILREAERENEILADIAGEEYESPGDIPKGKYVIEKRLLDAAQKKNELLEAIAEGSGGGGGAAKAIGIDYATDIISLKNKDGETITGSGATLPAYGVSFDPTTGGLTLTKNGTAVSGQTVTIPNYGSPVGVTDSADMVDEGTIYLYEGETGGGFTNGHFYYYDGTAWADGGEYAAATVQTDKTLLVEDRAADAKATGDAVGELKTQLTELEDIVNDVTEPVTETLTGTQTDNKTINYTATVVDAVSGYYVKTFSVNEGDKLIVNGMAVNGGYLFIYVDSNNDTIGTSEKNESGSTKSYRDVKTTAPANAVGIIVSGNTTTSFPVVSVTKITDYVAAGIEELDERIDTIGKIMVDVTETASVSSADWTEHDGEYMFTSGSTTTGTGWRYIEYAIPSIATGLIVTAKAGQSARLWILKNAAGTVLGYSSDSSSASVKTESINLSSYTGASKLFVNDKDSNDLSIQYQYIVKKVSGDDVIVGGTPLSDLINNSSPLNGKILCCAGDSITYGADMDSEGITNVSNIDVYNCDSSGTFTKTTSHFLKTWNWQIASRHNMTLYNGGVSGSTMQGENGVNGFSLANGRYTKLPDNIDYLLIWFGWNDNAYGTLGMIDDATNASFYGGYNVVLPYLIDKYPYAKIALIVPFGSSAGHRQAIRLLGNKWGVAVWDNYQGGTPLYYGKEDSVGVEASVVTANRAKFQANGAHPNFKGHRQLADMIEHWLIGI